MPAHRFAKLAFALCIALCIALGLSIPARPKTAVQTAAGAPSDHMLSNDAVTGWFDHDLTRGDGQTCPVRSGNDVLELVDGYATFKKMAEAINTARPNLTVLHNFAPGGPLVVSGVAAIAEGLDGNIYATADQGGAHSVGSVLKITPDGQVTDLYDFDVTHGSTPAGGLTRAKDGSFYGICYGGGKYGSGTIWRLSTAGHVHVLWDFRNGQIVPPLPYPKQPTEQQKKDAGGSFPLCAPVEGTDGNLYGVTSYANNQQGGVVYRITPGGNYKGLYMFNRADIPTLGYLGASITAGADGNVYGTTTKGGLGWGTVFKCTPEGAMSMVHRFDGKEGQTALNLIYGRDENGKGCLYGAASDGTPPDWGVVFKLKTTGEYSVLHTFLGVDGGHPVGGLAQAKDGTLYGTTKAGDRGAGVIFRVSPTGENYRVVHYFGGQNEGIYCVTRPILLHEDRYLYGLVDQGGSRGGGVFYRVDLKKPDFIYALNWWMSDDFPLYGPNSPSVGFLFRNASNRGVQVRAMLWRNLTSIDTQSPAKGVPAGPQNTNAVGDTNVLYNGAAILDSRTLNYGSHHQKVLVVNGSEGLIGFCGGIDFNPDRVGSVAGDKGSPYHDVHCCIKGPAAGDLLNIFVERWTDHPDHDDLDKKKDPLSGDPVTIPPPIDAEHGGTCWVQIGRTYGNGSRYDELGNHQPYKFAPKGEHTAGQMIIHAINNAKRFIYVEDQYFVDTAPNTPGLDVRGALKNALAKPGFQHLTILIPHGSMTDLGLPLQNQANYRRGLLIDDLKAAKGGEKVRVFYLAPPAANHTYVHAKTWIFDDEFAIIGSANCNRRSWTHDSEVVAGICDQGNPKGGAFRLPHRLRMRLWAEHLNIGMVNGAFVGYDARLFDGVKSADLWLKPPPGARILPYTDFTPEHIHSDDEWNKYVDPNGA